jgi:hypothetical protein
MKNMANIIAKKSATLLHTRQLIKPFSIDGCKSFEWYHHFSNSCLFGSQLELVAPACRRRRRRCRYGGMPPRLYSSFYFQAERKPTD